MTPSSHDRQAYLGLMVTSTRNCAGTMSSRSLLSSPIRCNSPLWQWQVLNVGDDLDPRQMCRQRSAIGATLASPHSTILAGAVVLLRLAGRHDLLDVFQTQQHLFLGQRLRPAAKAMSLQFLGDLAAARSRIARPAASPSASLDRQAVHRSA
jgi:hypothetical protein